MNDYTGTRSMKEMKEWQLRRHHAWNSDDGALEMTTTVFDLNEARMNVLEKVSWPIPALG